MSFFQSKTNFFEIVADQKDFLINLIDELENEDKLVNKLYLEFGPYEEYIKRRGNAIKEHEQKIRDVISKDDSLLKKIISKLRELLELIEEQEEKASSFDNVPDMMEAIERYGIDRVFGKSDYINRLSNEINDLFSELAQSLKETEKEVGEVDAEIEHDTSQEDVDELLRKAGLDDQAGEIAESEDKREEEKEGSREGESGEADSILVEGVGVMRIGNKCWIKSENGKTRQIYWGGLLIKIDHSNKKVTYESPINEKKITIEIEEFIEIQKEGEELRKKLKKEIDPVVERASEIINYLIKNFPYDNFLMAFIMGEKSFMLASEQVNKDYHKHTLATINPWKEFLTILNDFIIPNMNITILNMISANNTLLLSIRTVHKDIKIRSAKRIVEYYMEYLQKYLGLLTPLSSSKVLSLNEIMQLKREISNLIIERYAETSAPEEKSVVNFRAYKNQVLPLLERARTEPFETNYKYYIPVYDLLYKLALNNSDEFYKEELEKLTLEIQKKFESAITSYLESSVGKNVSEDERAENVKAAQKLFMLVASRNIMLFKKHVYSKERIKQSWREVIEEISPVLLEELEEEEPTLLEVWEDESPKVNNHEKKKGSFWLREPRNKKQTPEKSESSSLREMYEHSMSKAKGEDINSIVNLVHAYDSLKELTQIENTSENKKTLDQLEKQIKKEFETAIELYLEDSKSKSGSAQTKERKAARRLFEMANERLIRLFNKYPKNNAKDLNNAWTEIVGELIR